MFVASLDVGAALIDVAAMRVWLPVFVLVSAACSDDDSSGSDTDTLVPDVVDTELAPDTEPDEVDGAPEVESCPQEDPSPGCEVVADGPCRVEVGRGRCRLAVNGGGFLVLVDAVDNRRHVTSAELSIDGEGWLAAPGALFWQGTSADADGVQGSAIDRINVLGELPPVATTRVDVRVDLDPAAPIQTFDSGSAAATSSFGFPITIYDSRGTGHELDVWFSRSSAETWSWHAATTLGELDGSVSLTVTIAASGTLTFDGEGRLAAAAQGLALVTFHQAEPQTLAFDFGDAADGSTSLGSPSTLTSATQDGAGLGLVAFAEIDALGVVTRGSNDGRTRVTGQLGLSRFEDPCELAAAGTGAWTETFRSGPPTIAPSGVEDRGTIEHCQAP